MPKPQQFTPRTYLVHEELFGREGEVEWLQPETIEEYMGLRSAELQHHCMVAVSRYLSGDKLQVAWLEERAGLAAGRGTKLLRGHAHMSLRDLQAIEGVLGPILVRLDFQRTPLKNEMLRRRFSQDASRWRPGM